MDIFNNLLDYLIILTVFGMVITLAIYIPLIIYFGVRNSLTKDKLDENEICNNRY